MRIRSVIAFVAGSIAVHAAVSCAASRGGDVGSIADAVVDALGLDTSVHDARADGPPAPTPATVDDVACDRELVTGQWFAEKTFAGRTSADLSRGSAVVCGGPFGPPPGYCQVATLYVKDGVVAAFCGNSSGKATVRIVMPTP